MFELIQLVTQDQATDEGAAMRSAVGQWFPRLTREGVAIYSMREGAERVLTLSVRQDDKGVRYCDHVVGLANRPPTEVELSTLGSLLINMGVELRYNPNTVC